MRQQTQEKETQARGKKNALLIIDMFEEKQKTQLHGYDKNTQIARCNIIGQHALNGMHNIQERSQVRQIPPSEQLFCQFKEKRSDDTQQKKVYDMVGNRVVVKNPVG